ncbi:MAG TPA: FAD binding domain-containing protein [Stellaceae bacterium]|jgi:carbon-monoxide dehydrogenase medium subunit
MKAAEFDYARAGTVEEVCRLLDGAHGDGKIIAGGQTLVPLLVMRLARPSLVIDINRLDALHGVAATEDGVVIKAATRQADVLADEVVRRRLPLLTKALHLVGHPQTRNRGTIGGSLANADPAAEICLVARTLDAEITARGSQGERKLAMADFCVSAMTTALAPEECLTAIRFPAWRDAGRMGTGFAEMSVRHSDFALVAAACQLALDRDGVCRRIALGIGGAEAKPFRATAAEARLVGTRLETADLDKAMDEMQQALSPLADVHASADYRRRVAGALAARALAEARDEARVAA